MHEKLLSVRGSSRHVRGPETHGKGDLSSLQAAGRYTTSTAKHLLSLNQKIYPGLRKKILVAADLFVGLREI